MRGCTASPSRRPNNTKKNRQDPVNVQGLAGSFMADLKEDDPIYRIPKRKHPFYRFTPWYEYGTISNGKVKPEFDKTSLQVK